MCGIVGVYGTQGAAKVALDAMQWLQHRGEQGWGLCAMGSQGMTVLKRDGLYKLHPPSSAEVDRLSGDVAVGHLRYSTAGDVSSRNIQPLTLDSRFGVVCLAHNGNLVNFLERYQELKRDGATFSAGANQVTDTEVMMHRIVRSKADSLDAAVCDALSGCAGAYSVVVAAHDTLIAARDPFGYRPLCIGRKDGAVAIASETCALDMIGFAYDRDVAPGEVFMIREGKETAAFIPSQGLVRQCVFEFVYFANPASNVFGRWVSEVRIRTGRMLAQESPCSADIVVPVPDSGKCAALGYAQESGIPYTEGMVRSHYAQRTFIQRGQEQRDLAVRSKLLPCPGIVRGKRVVVVEDSVVRGTTTRMKLQGLYEAGAKEVHLRVASPPILHPCYMGIDFPSKEELLVNTVPQSEVARHLGIDSCEYLSQEGMLRAIDEVPVDAKIPNAGFCTACFDGEYPSGIPKYVQIGRCS